MSELESRQKYDGIIIGVFSLLLSASVFLLMENYRKAQIILQQKQMLQTQTNALYAAFEETTEKEFFKKETPFEQIRRNLAVQTKMFKKEKYYEEMLSIIVHVDEKEFYMANSDREQFLKQMRNHFYLVINDLITKYSLNKTDADFCVFSSLGLPSKVLYSFFSSEAASKSRRQRLRKKLEFEMLLLFRINT
ncbi:hypothetical protein D0T50_04950 [Bacteroides sp. 214]|nr:hypothetical protein [Bacteroides sp. 214]